MVARFFFYGSIAQSVEQRTENPRVAGSIPALGIYEIITAFVVIISFFYLSNMVF